MDKKYVFPVTTMLIGLGLWIVLVVLRLVGFGPAMGWLASAMCIASGSLILISGVACVSAGGPIVGVLVRLAVLLGLAAYAHWVVERIPAVTGSLVAAAGTVVVGIVALASRGRRETG
jgi:hypothetical protein